MALIQEFDNVGDLVDAIVKDMNDLAKGIATNASPEMRRMVSNEYINITWPLKMGDVEISKVEPKEFQASLESKSLENIAAVGIPPGVIVMSDDKPVDVAKEAKKHEVLSKKPGPFKSVFSKLSAQGVLNTFLKTIGLTTNFKLKRL